ncbi:hypothetical protein HDU98_003839 [Podochytrium sp. JEL0797]|nr:hypothetical protein HDU98_003839 [Podochytrium sp. JEL0797]
MMFYRRRIFTCEATGKSNLTFQAALQSEKLAKEKEMNRFPKLWRQCALEFIHFNRCMLNSLVDKLHDHLKERLFLQEVVTVQNKSKQKGATVKVMAIVGPHGTILAGEGAPATATDASEMHLAHSPKPAEPPTTSTATAASPYVAPLSDMAPSQLHYVVHVCDESGELYLEEGKTMLETIANGALRFQVKADECRRARNVFNKVNVRWYIKEVATRGGGNFDPWVVKDSLVKKYNLPTEPPARKRIRIKFDQHGTKLDCQFPMDDLELLHLAPPRDPDPSRPTLSKDFGTVPPTATPALMQTWLFLSIYGKSLHLTPFTLDAYTAALGAPRSSPLLPETMAALLTPTCASRLAHLSSAYTNTFGGRLGGAALTSAMAKAAAAAAATAAATAPSVDAMAVDTAVVAPVPDAPVVVEPINEFHEKYLAKFSTLTPFEQLAIDQWYKWTPKRWADPVRDVVPVPRGQRRGGGVKGGAGGGVEYTVAGRLRAWEVALIGFVRDCVEEKEFEGKWRVLSVLVGAVELEGVEEEVMEEVMEEVEEEEEEEDVEMEESVVAVSESNPVGEEDGGRRSQRKRRKVDTYFVPVAEHVSAMRDDESSRDGSFALASEDEGVVGRKRTTRSQWNLEHNPELPVHHHPQQTRTSGRNTRAAMAATQNALSLALGGVEAGAGSPLSAVSDTSSIAAGEDAVDVGVNAGVDKAQPSVSEVAPSEGDVQGASSTAPVSPVKPEAQGSTPLLSSPMKPDLAAADTNSQHGSDAALRKSHKFNPYKKAGKPTTLKLGDASSIQEMAGLLAASSRGFCALTTVERVQLIHILVEQWVSQTAGARAFADAMQDKIAEAKKYKREAWGKEQRELAAAKLDLQAKMDAFEKSELAASLSPTKLDTAADPDEEDGDSDDSEAATPASTHLSSSALRMRQKRKESAKKKERDQRAREEMNRLKAEKKEKDREVKAIADVSFT